MAPTKQNAYQKVTQAILDALDAGVVPWHRPWRRIAGHEHASFGSRKPYRGINVLLCELAAMKGGYSSRYWATFRQLERLALEHARRDNPELAERADAGDTDAEKELRGMNYYGPRRGEKATTIVLWRIVEKKTPAGQPQPDKPETFPVLRWFSVFNLDQTELPEELRPKVEGLPPDFDPIAEAEAIANGMPQRPTLTSTTQDRAYYAPAIDVVHMPIRGAFNTPDDYYATLYHELAHSTGHASRLNRPSLTGVSRKGDESYAKEELVAELASAFLVGAAGIEPRYEQNAAYIDSWRQRLKNDERLLVTAASQAQKAADFILGTPTENPTDDDDQD